MNNLVRSLVLLASLSGLAWCGDVMAAVTFQAAGTAVSGTGAVNPAWPTHQAGDIALLFVESAGGQPATLSTPAGFVEVANSPQSTGLLTAGTRITVFWARATSAAMATPRVADSGNHVYAQILTYRGAIATGNPWDVTGGGSTLLPSTSVTVTGVTTTVPNTLIVQVVSRDDDSSAAEFSAETNANLTGITERSDGGTTSGNGGGFAVWDGGKAAAGATGNTTATVTSSVNAFLTMALKPEPPPVVGTRFYMQNAAPDVATVVTNRGAWDNTGSVLQRKLSRTKAGPIASKGVAENVATGNWDVLLLKLVSEPIPTAQTISGTLNFVAGSQESNNAMNAHWHVHAYVTVGDTDALRGTLVNDYTEAAGTNEWSTTAAGDGPVAPLTLTPVAIAANDRIVIEVGYVARNTSTNLRTGTVWYGGTNAIDLGLGGNETTLPGWWEFSSDLFAVATAPHHIQIEHDGAGQTCRAETLTVTACANAACTAPHFTTATVTGNVTWAGTPGGSIPFTIAGGGTGQTTVLLPVTTAQTVTLGTSAVSPAETNPPSTCVNAGGGAACSLVFTAATDCFDAVEQGALATATALYTKLSGTPFSLDVLADTPYTGTLQVELVNAASGTCATYPQLSTQNTTFTSQTRKTLSFNYANAARNVKVRIRGLATPSCSSGRFAIRPQWLTVASSDATADASGSSASSTPVINAGTSFNLSASVTETGYDGTPAVDDTKVQAHALAVANGAVSGTFGAADPATGIATGNSFTYSEVGYFRMGVGGVYDDTFTAIDSAAGDCTNDFSNTMDAAGKYGCKFGNTAASSYFGRFIPDHFDTTITEVTPAAGGAEAACDDAFTYSGQPFVAAISAKNAANGLTKNYDQTAAYSKAVTLSDGNALAGGTFNNADLAAADFVAGTGATPDPTTAASPNYAFSSVKTAPATIKLRATETSGGDGVSSATGTEDTMEIRSGRLVLGNAYGSELLALTVPVALQYWTAGGYATNAADNCTMIPASSIVFTNFTQNLAACETHLSPGDLTFAAGVLPPLQLSAPGAGNGGSVDLSVNVSTVAAGNTCTGAAPSAATAARVPWFITDPARLTFGVYRGNDTFIYMRESY